MSEKYAHALVEWFSEYIFGGSMSCDSNAIVHIFDQPITKQNSFYVVINVRSFSTTNFFDVNSIIEFRTV